MRPIRVYTHTFALDTRRMVIPGVGDTPCQAKNAAFVLFERRLALARVEDPAIPATGWTLLRQDDVTHDYRVTMAPPVS